LPIKLNLYEVIMPKLALLLIFILLLTLSACQASPTPQTVSTLSVVQETQVASPIPATDEPASAAQPTEGAYPAPYPEASLSAPELPAETAYPVPYPGGFAQSEGSYPGAYPGSTTNSAGQAQPYLFKTSVPGSATVHGVLLVTDPMQSRPQDDDAIFLVPLVGEDVMSIPPFKVGEVPQAEVDEVTGEFTFTNIKPGRYAVVVLTVGEAQIPARFYDKDGFAILNVEDSHLDQTIELEYIFI
jgi:hypothetical protein